MCNNQLKLNEDKTEAILFNTFSVLLSLLTIVNHDQYVYTILCFQTQSQELGVYPRL